YAGPTAPPPNNLAGSPNPTAWNSLPTANSGRQYPTGSPMMNTSPMMTSNPATGANPSTLNNPPSNGPVTPNYLPATGTNMPPLGSMAPSSGMNQPVGTQQANFQQPVSANPALNNGLMMNDNSPPPVGANVNIVNRPVAPVATPSMATRTTMPTPAMTLP